MSIVNFGIPDSLEKRIKNFMKKKGFSSKAEFFRFSAIYYIDIIEKPIATEDERFAYLTDTVSREVAEKFKGKSLPSLDEQLSDI